MSYWQSKSPEAANIRLLVPGEGWKIYFDEIDSEGKVASTGSKRLIESAFLNALNSTNLLILTGCGSSFAVKNIAPSSKLAAPGMADLWGCVKTAVGDEVFNTVCGQFKDATINDNIERLLTLCKLYLELNENANSNEVARVKKFVSNAEKAILARVDFIDAETNLEAHSTLVTKIGRRGIRKPRTKFFTTNYDLCFEEAAGRQLFTVIDGFSHALKQVYNPLHFQHDIVRRESTKDAPDYIENVLHLYKLHGSLDWRRINGDIVRSRGDDGLPVLIYPRSSKYQESFEAPYLDMISALQASLREPDTAIIVSGFGFNDDHISRPILSALETNMSLRLIICDPVFLEDTALTTGERIIEKTRTLDNRFLNNFIQLANVGDARIHLMNGRFEDMASALPDLVGETDRERHALRIRTLKETEKA